MNFEEVRNEMKEWVSALPSKTVVFLLGEMGAGKTQIVRFFGEELGFEKEVSSPTFSIINEYNSKKGKVFHLDLYRLESVSELENVGFWDLFENADYIFIEWADKFPLEIPKGWSLKKIRITRLENGERKIIIQ